MAYHKIQKYMASWDFEEHHGYINLGIETDEGLDWKITKIENPSEYQVMIDLLRNEDPLFLAGTRIQTRHDEMVGEGEK